MSDQQNQETSSETEEKKDVVGSAKEKIEGVDGKLLDVETTVNRAYSMWFRIRRILGI